MCQLKIFLKLTHCCTHQFGLYTIFEKSVYIKMKTLITTMIGPTSRLLWSVPTIFFLVMSFGANFGTVETRTVSLDGLMDTGNFSMEMMMTMSPRPPRLKGSMKCVQKYKRVHLTIVCIIEEPLSENISLHRHDNDNNDLCKGDGDICDHDTYHAPGVECPETSFICTAHNPRTEAENSVTFTRQMCQKYVETDEKCRGDQFEGIEDNKKDGDPINVTAYAVPAVIFGLILIIILCVYCRWQAIREKLKTVTMNMLTEEEIREFLQGSTKIDPNDIQATIHGQPFDLQFEIDRHDLTFDDRKLLGSGHYGHVMKGAVSRRREDSGGSLGPSFSSSVGDAKGSKTVVAVKTLKPSSDILYFKALLDEVKIMTYLGKHENIIEFIGAVTSNIKNKEIFVVLEFCVRGDLHKCLKEGRAGFQNLFTEEEEESSMFLSATNHVNDNRFSNATMLSAISTHTMDLGNEDTFILTTLKLLYWARDIANGMAYLGSKKVIHGDLASRNVLIGGSSMVAKISDFGLSRRLVDYSNYVKTQKVPLPYKWMAIESLTDMEFSCQSDIWSYGVTLFEIFSLGRTPYPGLEWDGEFTEKINQGYRMKKPAFANKGVYNIMMDCWHLKPKDRPNFTQIYNRLQKILSNLQGLNVSNEYVCTN